MPLVPVLQILYRRKGDILFGWKPLLRAEVKSYNLYSSATSGGIYSLVKSNIPNEVDKTVYRGKVISIVKDTEIPIPPNEYIDVPRGGLVQGTNYYFKLTFIDQTDVESDIGLSPAIIVKPAQIEPFFENESEERNAHEFAWVESRKRWEKIQLTDDGKLAVDANVTVGDITIENVKVAARPDGTTLEYMLVDNNRKLVVRVDPNSISRINDYEEHTAIAKNVETTILTYTNVQEFFIEKISCSGTGDAVYKFKINGTTYQTLRSSWNNRNMTFDFSTIARKIPANTSVTITVSHVENQLLDFEASLTGFTFTI
jgi:hypothetical protein